jgi:hypothetical protein
MDNYRTYFTVDEKYFPQVNDYSIAAAGADFWISTYPHQTFIDMLSAMERILSRQEKRSLWIEGAYGTGKSQCAYALKRILEVPEEELRSYWNQYETLKKKTDLLEKIIGHKQNGILIIHRYASGGINTPRDLFYAIQESVKIALDEKKLYAGENTLKESVIAWIEKPANKRWLNDVLAQTEYASMFSQTTAEEVLIALRKNHEIKELMNNLFRLADKEGITALNIDSERLIAWLTDVIDTNQIKIVFIWDEFSDYFKNNRESLSEFQKIVELVNLKPFYLVVVTHESGQLYATGDSTWKKVRDRFSSVQISLPDNIAFELIGHAFHPIPAAKEEWDAIADDLNNRVSASRVQVMETARITNPRVMKDILPIHPMAALVLKNIASGFKSNQRSMFDFIKSSNTENVKAFQWFIENNGPLDDYPLLTVDMLWNFFYENGRNNLTSDIRIILDTYTQQKGLREDEQRVLKAVLIMQAIDQRLGGTIDLFKATEKNISYIFEGICSGLDVSSKNLAKQLVNKGVLVSNPIGDGKYVFSAAVLAGDQVKIDNYKKEISEKTTTSKLVSEGILSSVLSLPPSLRLRLENEPNTGKITPVTFADFTRTINGMRDQTLPWKFNAVIAFAKDDNEAIAFRNLIKNSVQNKDYEHIIIIDALSTPLGREYLEQYYDYTAMAKYYNGNNNQASRENSDKARHILDQDWKNRIYNGQFIVYTHRNPEGEKLGNGNDVLAVLKTIINQKIIEHAGLNSLFDFTKGLTENQLKLTNGKSSAKSGILQTTSGVMVGCEKHVLHSVWKTDEYWTSLPNEDISKIKNVVNGLIEESFNREGQISIGEIYDVLEKKYGFPPCNLSAFIVGFLLKEYSGEPYRYSDSSGGHDHMSPDKLAEMIGNYVGKNPKPTYIVKMTPEEKQFYEITEKAWKINPHSCFSVGQTVNIITRKMRDLGFPIWCLSFVDENDVYPVLEKYIEIVQKVGRDAQKLAVEIGKITLERNDISEKLSALISTDKCQNGMRLFLQSFESGRLLTLANDIGANQNYLSDIRDLFSVENSCLWNRQIGEEQIRKLILNYSIVKESNQILNVNVHSLEETYKEWRNKLRFIYISYQSLKERENHLSKIFDFFMKIYQGSELLYDQKELFYSELKDNQKRISELMNYEKQIFLDVYAPYLENLSDNDIVNIKTKLPTGLFEKTMTECNSIVKTAADEYRKNLLKTQLVSFWKEKTDTKNPREWSKHYRTPILCCVPVTEFLKAKKTFETLNRNFHNEGEVKEALSYLQKTDLFQQINSQELRDQAFKEEFIGKYCTLFSDIDLVKEALERLPFDTYDWYENPTVKNKIKELAQAEYNAGGSDEVLKSIDQMDDTSLKQYLKLLVKDNMMVGIEIIMNRRK